MTTWRLRYQANVLSAFEREGHALVDNAVLLVVLLDRAQ
jgi:hypothetical protein